MKNYTAGGPAAKQDLGVPQSDGPDLSGKKYPAKAKGGSLAEGLSMEQSIPDVGNMYEVHADISKMPKGNDRI